ncbi:uncharacterized protein C6orf118 homolog isoform X2 [Rhinatrema bivittatum]|uniref:uncharacterized protein C6orf118 homolog isoform X2 n=1 Tax=Rhinatrema bivittatum TaxID=194408 RepID=UPI001129B0DE|nr:uncharacterized protein C6orf118 homolog isoform X2 [Rhinatrema bivittatum]
MHESKKQKPVPLKVLLDGVEKANKADIQVYTSGHLNYNNLYKPSVLITNFWDTSKDTTPGSQRKSYFVMPTKLEDNVNMMKKSWAEFTINTSLVSSHKLSTSLVLDSEESKIKKLSPVSPIKTQFAGFFQETSSEDDGLPVKERTKEPVQKEELDLPELQLLKFKCAGTKRSGNGDITAEYHFLPSYLAGLTKKDQLKMLKLFNKEYLRKNDLLENDLTKHTIVEGHKRKLMKELLKISDVSPLHFKRLQIFRDCFEDVCNNSANAYELYVQLLLASQPGEQCKTFLVQLHSVSSKAVKTCDVDEAMKNVKALEKKAKAALKKNEKFRNELETEMLKSQTRLREELYSPVEIKRPTKEYHAPTLQEQFLFKKYQILALWDEIQELNQKMKDNLTFEGHVFITEEEIKNAEARALKLYSSNKLLERTCKDLDADIKRVLGKQKVKRDVQEEVKYLLNKFLSYDDDK